MPLQHLQWPKTHFIFLSVCSACARVIVCMCLCVPVCECVYMGLFLCCLVCERRACVFVCDSRIGMPAVWQTDGPDAGNTCTPPLRQPTTMDGLLCVLHALGATCSIRLARCRLWQRSHMTHMILIVYHYNWRMHSINSFVNITEERKQCLSSSHH